MRSAWLVLKKECLDNLRDRRTLLSTFGMALIGPWAFVGLMAFVLNQAVGKADEPLELTVSGAEYAPGLIDALQRQNTELTLKTIEDAQAAVRDGDESLVLVIPSDYAVEFNRGHPVFLALVYNSSEFGSSQRRFRRARGMLNRYAQTLGLLRLQLRGVATSTVVPVRVREVDTATPAARALMVLATFPYLLIMIVFMGGFYLAIDSTAGEREHGSLEPLLTQPVSRTQLVMGKIAAAALFAGLATILFVVNFGFAIPLLPLERVGMSLTLGVGQMLAMIGVAIPLMVFGAALLTVVASFAKSYKEAQTYLSLVILVPTLPLIVTSLADFDASWWLMAVPSLSQSKLLSDIIVGEPIIAGHVVLSVVCTSICAAGLVWFAVRLYQRERILG